LPPTGNLVQILALIAMFHQLIASAPIENQIDREIDIGGAQPGGVERQDA
jgi:hypothetical protein